MAQFADNQWFDVTRCCECGMAFAMTTEFQRRRLEDRKSFFCPAGHSQHFTGATEAQKLKDQLERERQQREAAEARASTATHERDRIAKAHSTMRQRVVNGVCPCCNRTFQNLLNHMRTEHAEFVETPAATLATLRRAFGMSQGDVAAEVGVSQGAVSAYERGVAGSGNASRGLDEWVKRHESKAPLPDAQRANAKA